MTRDRCILFDLDGTLVDSLPDIAAAVNAARAALALDPLPVAEIAGMIGCGMESLVRRAVEGEHADAAAALRMTRDYYLEHPAEDTRPYPGVTEGLSRLRRRGFRLGVVTNKPRAIAELVLRKLDLLRFMDRTLGDDGRLRLKPDPEGCLLLLTQFGVPPRDGWVVGDNWTDLEAGRRAGMRRVWARWGYGDPRDESWDFACADFAEVVKYLEEQIDNLSEKAGQK